MSDLGMAERVRERLDALKMNAFEAARRAGFERGYVNDLLSGKKRSIRGDSLARLASVLECSPGYLMGENRPVMPATPARDGAGIPLSGVVEAGTWRERPAQVPASIPQAPDPRFQADAQRAWIMRGPTMELIGIQDGDLVVTVDLAVFERERRPVRDGDVLVIVRRDGDRTATELRQMRATRHGVEYVTRSSQDDLDPITGTVETAAVVVRAVKIFGDE